MTPLKALIVDGLDVYTEDFTNIRTLCFTAANEDQLEWIVLSLCSWHKVVAYNVDVNVIKGSE